MINIGIGIPFGQRKAGAPAFQALLDLYPNAAAAYSLRKLRAAYTGAAVRIRRSSDNTETDIGFLNNEFDSAAAQTFCGAGNGFVTTWYDQSEGSNNLVQTTAANQPQIVSSGVVLTQNSKATIKSDGTNDLLRRVGSGTSTQNSLICVYKANVLGSYNTIASVGNINSTNPLNMMLSSALTGKRVIYSDAGNNSVDGNSTTNFELSSIFSAASSIEMNVNGSLQTLTNNTRTLTGNQNNIQLFADTTYGDHFNGVISEVIYYNTNKVADKSGIQSNINTYYGIY